MQSPIASSASANSAPPAVSLNPRATHLWMHTACPAINSPDLLIITVAGNILADVVGYHPTCKSALANSSYESVRANVKIRKYENAAIHHRFSFTPFVFQAIGGLAGDAVTLIEQILRNNSSNIPYNTLKYLAMSEMSVAIQRENGNMFWRTLINHFSQ